MATSVSVLSERGWLSRRPPDFREAVLRLGRRVRWARGDHVFRLDESPGGIYGILTGCFGLMAASERGAPRLGHVMHPGEWFGEGPLLTGRPRLLAARAMTDGELLHLTIGDLQDLGKTHPEWHQHLGALVFENLAMTASVAADLLLRRGEARLAAVLLRAAGRTINNRTGPIYPVPLSQTDLGEMANVSRQMVNATLGRWTRGVGSSFVTGRLLSPTSMAC